MYEEGERDKEVVRGYLEHGFEAAGRGDTTALAKYFAPHYKNHTSRHHDKAARGLAGVEGYAREVMSAIKDFSVKVDMMVAEGDLVSAHWNMQGVHHGTHKLAHVGEVAGTGKGLSVSGVSLFRLKEGKIVEGWVYDNVLTALMEIGAIASPR